MQKKGEGNAERKGAELQKGREDKCRRKDKTGSGGKGRVVQKRRKKNAERKGAKVQKVREE
jgi:hypothetical protein